MAICPHCLTASQDVLDPCPTGDGYYCLDEADVATNRDEDLLGIAVGGRFVIMALLGTGSMAKVYRAHQLEVDRTVALKVFRTDELFDGRMSGGEREEALESSRARFVQEARVLGKLAHPNCVTLYDFGTAADGRYLFIAMEYVGGISLRRAINRGLRYDAILEITHQVLLALREAHDFGVVHRDLKPENIIMSFKYANDEPVVKVVDFGIAKLLGREGLTRRTNFGALFGTPAYMSPEQCRGSVDEVGPHSDIYALGCILFEMVCGRLPFESQLPIEMIRMHIDNPTPELVLRPGLQVPEQFVGFIERCLRKDPAQRYPEAHAALQALTELGELDAGRSGTFIRGKASAGPKGKVVVPGNRIAGVEIDPPRVDTPTHQSGPSAVVVAPAALHPAQIGGVLDTHDGDSSAAAPPATDGRKSLFAGALLALAFVFLLTSCLLLFFFIWNAAA